MSGKFLQALGASRLYPLTDRLISGLSHADQITSLQELGVTLVQLREKSLSPREFYSEAEAALNVARRLKVKVVINDRVDVALALAADGVHLGQDDIHPEVARALLGSEPIIGISTHNLEQAQIAAKMPVDYVAIGPIFPSSTKESAHSAVGPDQLALIRNALGSMPLVAIGGIHAVSRQQVLDSGADGLAVISDLWNNRERWGPSRP